MKNGQPHPAVAPDQPDSIAAARAVGLRYVSDAMPGITRRRAGRASATATRTGVRSRTAPSLPGSSGWRSLRPGPTSGSAPIARATSRRPGAMRGAASSTATTPLAGGPGRGQVRAACWPSRRRCPAPRARGRADLARRGLPREKVLATVVRLLERTLIRVGNEEYARENGCYGLTTLRDRHVDVAGSELRFEFRGKSGKEHRIVGARPAPGPHRAPLPGAARPGAVPVRGRGRRAPGRSTPADVNAYLREITGEQFTAKDFRTWAGTVLALAGAQRARELRHRGRGQAQRHARDRAGGRPARQHRRRLPQELHPSRGRRRAISTAACSSSCRGGSSRCCARIWQASVARKPPCWPCCSSVSAAWPTGEAGKRRGPAESSKTCSVVRCERERSSQGATI